MWLGTNNLATRYAQLGINPLELSSRELEVPSSVTASVVANTPQFDTNFRFCGETRFPVLVEYVKEWYGGL